MPIAPLEKEQAAEAVRAIYEGMEKKAGRVLNMYKVMAHKPNVLQPFLDFYKQVWAAGALDPKIKELAYLRTSLMNGCTYCSRAHTASAKRRGVTEEQVQALKEPGGSHRDVFTAEEQAALQFAERLTA
jgi:AhpD family alkylhydroperoxidase